METIRTKAVVESKPQIKMLKGIIASIALHVVVASLMMLSTIEAQPEPAERESVLVEVLSNADFKETQKKPTVENLKEPSVDTAPIDKEQTIEAEKKPEIQNKPKVGVKPSTDDAKNVPVTSIGAHPLPRARQIREKRKALTDDKQREALCHAQAIAQIKQARSDLEPDLVISAAVDQFIASGDILLSNGAAFRSKGRWYNFKFKCETLPDLKKVAKFEFLIGAPFPQEEIETRNATTDN